MPVPEGTSPSIWRRIAAYLCDYFVLFALLIPLQVVIFLVGNGFPYSLLQTGPQIELWVFLSVSLPVWLYFALTESSSHRATLGKRLLKLQVTDVKGYRIGFWRAILRTVIKLIPWELTHLSLLLPLPAWWDPSPAMRPGIIFVYLLLALYIITMFLNQRRQSIHDLIAQTVVVEYGREGAPLKAAG